MNCKFFNSYGISLECVDNLVDKVDTNNVIWCEWYNDYIVIIL